MKKKSSCIWILFLALLAFWFASTWVVSLSHHYVTNPGDASSPLLGSLQTSKTTVKKGEKPIPNQRHAKDIFSYFGKSHKKKIDQRLPQVVHPREPHKYLRIQQDALPLTAYLEDSPLPPYDSSKTPRLASRTPGPLKKVVYESGSNSNICAEFPNAFPIQVPQDNSDCPIMADPFLPWIHDAFVDSTQTVVEFIAHNQRRCNTNPKQFYDRLAHLEPQAILQQSVPVKKLDNHQYRLASLEEADVKETRFICRFHDVHNEVLGETLSVFPYNYEHANYQKNNAAPLLTRPQDNQDTKTALHNEQVWNSLLRFQCPIPKDLQSILKRTNDVTLYVDVVPIRTHGRLDRAGYFDRVGRNMAVDDVTFDPMVEWGTNHVLPPIEQSGRWANIPLCPSHQYVKKEEDIAVEPPPPKHFLTACVWASAKFSTRGSSDTDASTSERLLEWLTYQLYMAGMDHIYIYDNTSPGSAVTLEPVTSLFQTSKITRIPWKHPVCNNNRPGAPNPGERSSQYTAEASCRIRFGRDTKWMAVVDTDEYFIPQPPYSSIRAWLEQQYSGEGPTKVLSFYQTRANPNRDYLDQIPSEDDPQWQWSKKPDTTYLETYNCDRQAFPKPQWAWRAKKQIFQPSYVLHHFVHYTLVTQRLLDHPTEASGLYNDRPPYEKRVDEQKEAFMLHTKTTYPQATQYWRKQCKENKDNSCPIGIPFPPGVKEGAVNDEGMKYNCYAHDRVTKDIVPELRKLLEPLQTKYRAQQA